MTAKQIKEFRDELNTINNYLTNIRTRVGKELDKKTAAKVRVMEKRKATLEKLLEMEK